MNERFVRRFDLANNIPNRMASESDTLGARVSHFEPQS